MTATAMPPSTRKKSQFGIQSHHQSTALTKMSAVKAITPIFVTSFHACRMPPQMASPAARNPKSW